MLSEALRLKILDFRDQREWAQFHNFRTLSTSIVLEAAELAENTQWTPDAELDEVVRSKKVAISQEIADIVILLTYLAHDLGIDLEQAVGDKLKINSARYPVDRAKGSSKKYNELD